MNLARTLCRWSAWLLAAWLASACGGNGTDAFFYSTECRDCPGVDIVTDASDVTAFEGSMADFSVVVSSVSADPVTVRWERCDPGPISGGCWRTVSPDSPTNFGLRVGPVTASDNGAHYRAVASASFSRTVSVGRNALLTVQSVAGAPVLTAQPRDATAAVGSGVSFAVIAAGDGLNYQWQISRDGGRQFEDIASSNTPTYVRSGTVQADDGALFRVVISNAAGSVTSQPARLTVPIDRSPVTYIDADFADSTWSSTVYIGGHGGSASATARVSGGNPGSFRSVRLQMNPAPGATTASSVFAFYFAIGTVYDPVASGGIVSIDFSQDARLLAGGGSGQATSLALRQGGQIYYAVPAYDLTPDAQWTAKIHRGLVATDFVAIAPDLTQTPQRPDFSARGAPIEFGFLRANSTSFGGGAYATEGGIDNWKVLINRAP